MLKDIHYEFTKRIKQLVLGIQGILIGFKMFVATKTGQNGFFLFYYIIYYNFDYGIQNVLVFIYVYK
jgi:hypothetical protein